MTPYDEGQVLAFIDDATAAYLEAHRSPDPHALVWVARMQFDAITMGYQSSRAKHLAEVRDALGLTPPATTTPIWPPVIGGDYREWFMGLVEGRPFSMDTLQALSDLGALASANVVLSPRNADHELTKIGLPNTDGSRTWVRVGFGEDRWVWMVQPA